MGITQLSSAASLIRQIATALKRRVSIRQSQAKPNMDDPAIVTTARASGPGKPPTSRSDHVMASVHASQQHNVVANGVAPLENKIRGMIYNHQTVPKHGSSSNSSGPSTVPSPNMTAQNGLGYDSEGASRRGQSWEVSDGAAAGQTANTEEQTPGPAPAQQRQPVTTLPRHLAHQADQSSKSIADQPAGDVQRPQNETEPSQGRNQDAIYQSGQSPSGRNKRPNQKQRRQNGTLLLQDLQQPTTTQQSPASSRNQPGPLTLPPHLRNVVKQNPVHQPKMFYHQYPPSHHVQPLPHYHRQHTSYEPNYAVPPPDIMPHGTPFYQQMPSHYQDRRYNVQRQQQPSPFARPNQQPRQLYEPHLDRRVDPFHLHRGDWITPSAWKAQSDFLDHLVSVEVPKAQIDAFELEEKERLRLTLQEACQSVIAEYELSKDAAFDTSTVALRCFGSVGSGFAMSGSDMDLALLSPLSSPEPASPDSELPRLLEKRFLDIGYGARLLTRTRVPIIRFCEKPTPELAEALHQARRKWEKAKDEPAAPNKQKKNKKGELGQGSYSEAATNPTKNPVEEGVTADGDLPEVVPEEKDHRSSGDNIVADTVTAMTDLNIDESSLKPTLEVEDAGSHDDKSEPKADNELVRLYGLAMSEGWFDAAEKSIIVKFITAVKAHGPDGAHDLKKARDQLQDLPNVIGRYREPSVNPLDLPKTGVGIQCDINFSNHLGLHNTNLLRCYTICDERVKPMVIFVKLWAKRRKINSPYHGTLSSYGYVLMVLHYLMNIAQPPVIPNLQRVPRAFEDTSPGNAMVIEGYTVRFWRNEDDIRRVVASPGFRQNHTDTVGSLLRGFYQYYAHPSDGGFQWSTDVLSLRTLGGLMRKDAKGWTGAKTVTTESNVPGEDAKEIRHRYLFAIEDPFELDHNIARTVVHNGIVAIRDEIRRAHRIIQNQNRNRPMTDGDILAEAESKEHLQYRYFGPLILNFGKEKPVMKQKDDMPTVSQEEVGDASHTPIMEGREATSSLDPAPGLEIPVEAKEATPAITGKGEEAIPPIPQAPDLVIPEKAGSANPAPTKIDQEATSSSGAASIIAHTQKAGQNLTTPDEIGQAKVLPKG